MSSHKQEIKEYIGEPKSIAILGYGVEGRSSYKILREIYPETKIYILDKNDLSSYPRHGYTCVVTGSTYLDELDTYDVIIRSPGIRIDNIIKRLDNKPKVTSQLDIFTHLRRERIVGVTGTKGKSTTTSLIHHIIDGAYKVALVGNIGVPALDTLAEEYDYYVCEYSCHQLSDISASPKYAILLNLFPEHLDYYDNVEDYFAAKKNIFLFQKEKDRSYTIPGLESKSVSIDFNKTIRLNNVKLEGDKKELKVDTETIQYNSNLIGKHNKINQLFAISVACDLGINVSIIKNRLSSFIGLTHRLETVYKDENLRYINDSISTIPQSCIAAMKTFDDLKIVLIGGHDRGIDYGLLVSYLDQNPNLKVILFSEVGDRIRSMVSRKVEYFNSFKDAVNFTLNIKLQRGTILLSPAASSYDEFSSFIERGEVFKEQILNFYKN